MSPVSQGRYCQTCCKPVVDFTNMSDKQVLDVISKAAGQTCGRFTPQQLQRPIVHQQPPVIKPYKLLLSAFIPAFLLSATNAKSQVKGRADTKIESKKFTASQSVEDAARKPTTITGIVEDESGSPPAGAGVVIKGTNSRAVTDSKGAFSMSATAGYKKVILQVEYVGYEIKEVEVKAELRQPLKITFTAKDLQQLGEVVVVGYVAANDFEEKLPAIFKNREVAIRQYAGAVLNEAGEGVPFASIKLNGKKEIIADSSGRFKFDIKENKKSISIFASSTGYQAGESIVALNDPKLDTVEVTLKNQPALDQVTVKCNVSEALTGMAGGLAIIKTVSVFDTANTFVHKVFNKQMFKSYPNPARRGSNLSLTFKKTGNYSVQLFDNAGKLYVQKEYLNQPAGQVVAFAMPANVPTGTCYLKAIDNSSNKQFVDKVLIW